MSYWEEITTLTTMIHRGKERERVGLKLESGG